MPARPLHAPLIRLTSSSVPPPLRALLHRARLAEPPVNAADLSFDGEARGGAEKILLSFRASRADINLFVLLSPALRTAAATRLEDEAPAAADHPERLAEPEHPWWRPDPRGPGRRFAYHTSSFDFVEVVIEDLTGMVFVRAIN